MDYDKTTGSETKRKLNDPLSKIGGGGRGDIYGLRGFVKRLKTRRWSTLKEMAATPPPMTIYV